MTPTASLSLGQMEFNGASAAGELHEQAFNSVLARVLRRLRKAWRENPNSVQAERVRRIEGSNDRPDIVVDTPDAYPLVVEVEFNRPAEVDARKRIGRKLVENHLPIRSAIAVGVPNELRALTEEELEHRLTAGSDDGGGIVLEFVWVSGNVVDGDPSADAEWSEVDRWPLEGRVTGDVYDLADLCLAAAAPPALVEEQTRWFSDRLRAHAQALGRWLHDDVALEIAVNLGQDSVPQALRLACCIWMTTCGLHDQLATLDALRGKGLRRISEMQGMPGGTATVTEMRQAWQTIIEHNYRSIFKPALRALGPRFPSVNGAEILGELALLSERLANLRLGNSVDFAGELFPKLLDDRKDTAAFYTLSPSAELLATLAIERLAVGDWSSTDEVSNLQIADLACGTGSLLRAAYVKLRAKHDAKGGDVESLHKSMMERSLVGLDINALAKHMTAAGLSGLEIRVPYRQSRIGSVEVSGGKTGSLELLDGSQVADITGEEVEVSGGDSANITVEDGSLDLVIQNPPYTRAHGGRGVFAMAGMTDQQRARSSYRLRTIVAKLRRRGDDIANGQAGLGSHFSALADLKLKKGGVFSSVLPLTAAHAESWQGFRRAMATDYQQITVLSIASHRPASFSADTAINELLIVARKTDRDGDANAEKTALAVNLWSSPATAAEAIYLAKAVLEVERNGGGQGKLAVANSRAGSWYRFTPDAEGFPWYPVGVRSEQLTRAFENLLAGRVATEPIANVD